MLTMNIPLLGKRLLSGLLLVLLSLSSTVQADKVTYYVNDLQGSPVLALDEQANVLWREDYKPYGEKTQKAPASLNDVGYTGHQNEDDIGLVYMQQRFYDPVLGRFYSNDPVGFTQAVDTFNRYSYVANNPYKYADPDGSSKVAWLVKLTDGGAQKLRSLTSSQAIRARENGQNIQMMDGKKSSAMAIERAANNGSKQNILSGGDHAKGHILNKTDVANGAPPIRGMPHVQTDGKEGHTFYSIAAGATAAVADAALNSAASGLESVSEGIKWAEQNLPNTMGMLETGAAIMDPTTATNMLGAPIPNPFAEEEPETF